MSLAHVINVEETYEVAKEEHPCCCGGKKNVKYISLVEPSKRVLPPLYIKVGLMKNFMKALDQGGENVSFQGNIFEVK